jgi:CheY-like chemotaxis protein
MNHILIVEDDVRVADGLSRLLLKNSYSITVVPDGRGALEVLDQATDESMVGLVLLDLMLPRVSGWQVLDAILLNERWRHVPVVVLTSAPAPVAPGAAAVMRKPVSGEEVLAAVRRYCLATA